MDYKEGEGTCWSDHCAPPASNFPLYYPTIKSSTFPKGSSLFFNFYLEKVPHRQYGLCNPYILLMTMNNPGQLVLSLQEYIVELQTENRSLKQHIFTLQEKLQTSSSTFHDEMEKLKVYIDHCQNQIIKRENREVGLLELVSQLEVAKEDICRERDIYIQQIEDLRKELQARQDDIGRMQRQEEALKLSLSPQNKNIQNLPPKSNKCRNCQAYIKNQQVLQQQVTDRQQTILSLQGDLLCLREFI